MTKQKTLSFIEATYLGFFYAIGVLAYIIFGLAGAGIILGWAKTRNYYFGTGNKKRKG